MNKFIILGVLVLLVAAGWFGFNAKSTATKAAKVITAVADGGISNVED